MPITLVSPAYGGVRIRPDDHVVASTVRNEILRLPYFLEYYRTLGFDRFLVVDNGSSDGTHELLLEQPDVTLFWTKDSYAASNFGVDWINAILDAHCHGRWVLAADADELLIWPGCEHESVKGLTAWLEGRPAEALFALMVDMYSDRPFGDVGYVAGTPFQDAAPFFDRMEYWLVEIEAFPHRMMFGGARARLFQALDHGLPAASKVPLVRWRRGLRFGGGCHIMDVGDLGLAPMRGALLHFKMFDDAVGRCKEEVARGEHYEGGREYESLGLAIEVAAGRCFFDPEWSVRYEGPAQLVELSLMHGLDPFGHLPGRDLDGPGPGQYDARGGPTDAEQPDDDAHRPGRDVPPGAG